MEEYKIGETFYIGRKKFQVVEGNCTGCHLQNNTIEFCLDLENCLGSCHPDEREDKKGVCYKLIED